MNAVNSGAAHPSCEICGFIDHMTENCQVVSPFAENTSDQVNYVNDFNLRLTNNPYSNAYNPRWRNHPNFLYRPNPSTMPQMNARQPPKFQRPPFPQQAHQKSNPEVMIEGMFLV